MDPLSIINRFVTADHWDQQTLYLELRLALRALDAPTAQSLITSMLNLYDQQVDSPIADSVLTILQKLKQVRPEVCTCLPAEMLKRQIFGHGILYTDADAAICTELIAVVEAAHAKLNHQFPGVIAQPGGWSDPSFLHALRGPLEQMTQTFEWKFLNQALRLLAWIDDESVRRWFQQQRAQTTTWGSLFYLSIDDYITEGGWELTAEGGRRNLYFPNAYQLVSSTEASDDTRDAVTVIVSSEEYCQCCGCPLTVLFDLDLSHPALSFLHIDGHRLRIFMCEGCFIDNHFFMEVDFEGNAHWSSFNSFQFASYNWDIDDLIFTPPDRQLVLGPPCASPFEVADSGDNWDVSQLGGMPSWVQDPEYVTCPSCHRHMIFAGQIVPGDVTDRAVDGILYGFLCLICHLSAVTYQCT